MNAALRWVLFLLIFFCTMPSAASAQYQFTGFPGVEKTALLSFTPEHPEPGETVHLLLQSPVIDLSKAAIVWYENGKRVASGTGLTETDVTTPLLGEETDIEVDVSTPDVTATANAVIIPAQIDLLYDSTSYTPPFYLGRALPSTGSQLRLQAFVRFKRPDGSYVPDAQVTYTWRKNALSIPHASGKGLSAIVIEGPTLYDSATIDVKAEAEGGFVGSAKVFIPPVKPALILYEDNPLYGYMYHQPLAAQSVATENEMTVASVPLFSRTQSPNDPSLRYSWRVNDEPVEATSSAASEITLGAKSGGLAKIALDLSDDGNIFFTASGFWSVLFSPHSSSPSPVGDSLPIR